MQSPPLSEPTYSTVQFGWTRGDARVFTLILPLFAAFLVWPHLRGIWGDRRQVDLDSASPSRIVFALNLNDGAWTEFALLPGVGETLAHRIVDFREAQGGIDRLEALQQVKGIGPKLTNRIRGYVVADPLDERPMEARSDGI